MALGSVRASAFDAAIDGRGSASGTLGSAGEALVLDITLEAPDERLAHVLFDANNFHYPVAFPEGSLIEGTLGIWNGDGAEATDGLRMVISSSGEDRPFMAESADQTPDGRSVVLDSPDASGLSVRR